MSAIGIVGAEEAKFSVLGKERACEIIRRLLTVPGVESIISGGCHLGGIDKWAAEIGMELELNVTEYLPKTLTWTEGYKPRNLLIAGRADVTHCIAVKQYLPEYRGMRFKMCYHCGTDDHVKSGGCYTTKQAIRLGKTGKLWVVDNY